MITTNHIAKTDSLRCKTPALNSHSDQQRSEKTMALVASVSRNSLKLEEINVSAINHKIDTQIEYVELVQGNDKLRATGHHKHLVYRPLMLALAILGIGLQTTDALAATYYVNNSTGND